MAAMTIAGHSARLTRGIPTSLQYGQVTQRSGKPATGPEECLADRPKANHALTLKLEHPMGAPQEGDNVFGSGSMTGIPISDLVKNSTNAGRAFRPQIDAMRAFAVMGVLYAHFLVSTSAAGSVGVRLFFVISGFLITRILLDLRERSASGNLPLYYAWRNFFVRRILRIFPIYYLILAAAYIFDLDGFREVAVWHAGFASNILFTIRDTWIPWPTAHLWSLSVEEQFYVFWPLVVLLFGFRTTTMITILVVGFGLFFRSKIVDFGLPPLGYWILPPGAFDTLGAGALLALLERRGWLPEFLIFIAPFAALYLFALCIRDLYPVIDITLGRTLGYAQDPLTTLSLTALVTTASVGAKGLVGKVLEFPPLIFIGRISYGIYLYHFFVLALYYEYLSPLNSELFPYEKGLLASLWATSMTLIVATISWYAIEAPLNGLKRHVPYFRSRAIEKG